MIERSVLLAQIAALESKLAWVKQVLAGTAPVEPVLHQRLSVRFAQLIDDPQRRLGRLRDEVRSPVTLGQRTDAALERHWQDFEEIGEACTRLFGESLAFLGGLLIRHYQLDHLTCLIADGLCEYLGKTSQVSRDLLSIPAAEDSFTGLTNIIRVHFPDFSIWGLPIVAHEFGHYVEAERRDRTFPYLFSDLLAAEGEGPGASGERESVLREQFADLFAVYALGPAYACTCILLEFDPRKADVDPSRHPSDARRVHFLLQALERMQESDRTRPYGWIIGRLTDLWLAGIRAVGKPESLTGEQVRQLDYRLNAMYEILDNPAHQLAGARYELQRWSRVQSLRDALTALASNVAYAAEPEIERRVENVLRGQPYPVILPDVLNAAWLCRLQKEQLQPDVISQCALLMCRKILGQ